MLPAMESISPVDTLIACHVSMMEKMDRAEALAQVLLVDGAPAFDAQASEWAEIASFFRSVVAAHSRDEELGLFPLMIELNRDTVERFTFDHRWIEQSEQMFLSRYEALAQSAPCIDSTRVREFAIQALEIVGHYRNHVRREEEELFPVARTALSGQALADLEAFMKSNRVAAEA
jgi:hemerythrin-like domain-containing protein